MQQAIHALHLDEADHWVAELEGGHNQYVRHNPPWTSRPWVIRATGRQAHLGRRLDCRKGKRQAEESRGGS